MKFVLAVLLALAFPFAASADVPIGGAQCVAKDQVIEANLADGIKFRKVNDAEAAVLTAEIKAQNLLTGKSYVVFWMERERTQSAPSSLSSTSTTASPARWSVRATASWL